MAEKPLVELYVVLLLALTIAGLVIALRFSKKHGTPLNFGTLLLLNYTIIQPVSGIVHLLNISGADRGYFDLLKAPSSYTLTATICAILGLGALTLGYIHGGGLKAAGARRPGVFWLGKNDIIILSSVLLFLIPLTFYSLMQIQGYAANSGLDRLIQVDGGFARYAYMAQWIAWVITFVALLLLARRRGLGAFWSIVIIGIGCILMTFSMRWSGSRSATLLFALPMVKTLQPRFGKLEKPAVAFGLMVLLIYAQMLSAVREVSLSVAGQSGFIGWLDWQWGRFSMSGYAAQHVQTHGYLYGETLLNAIVWTLQGFGKLVGVDLSSSALRSSSAVASLDLTNNPDAIYIVPGFNAEMYMNFGIFGVIVGCYILARVVAWVEYKSFTSRNCVSDVAWNFVGALLVFRLTLADSSTFPSYAIYIGVALFCTAMLVAFVRRNLLRANERMRFSALRYQRSHR